jgi:hypothetical protein
MNVSALYILPVITRHMESPMFEPDGPEERIAYQDELAQRHDDEEFLALERADELRDEFHQVIREINAWHL